MAGRDRTDVLNVFIEMNGFLRQWGKFLFRIILEKGEVVLRQAGDCIPKLLGNICGSSTIRT